MHVDRSRERVFENEAWKILMHERPGCVCFYLVQRGTGSLNDVVCAICTTPCALRHRVEIEYFIGLLSMSPPLPQLAAVKPEPVLALAPLAPLALRPPPSRALPSPSPRLGLMS